MKTTLCRRFFTALALCLCCCPYVSQAQTNTIIRFPDGYSPLYVDEDSGTVTVNVLRQGDFDFPSSVRYRASNTSLGFGETSATPGLDFLPVEGTLDFGPNETNKTFSFTVLADNFLEGDEDFSLELDQATAGVNIQTPEVQVVIRDGERNPIRVDPDFKPDWPFHSPYSPPYLSWPYISLPQPDGRLVCVQAAYRMTGSDGALIVRLMPDGRRDPGWAAPVIDGSVGVLCLQTNGQVLFSAMGLSGPDFTVSGQTCRHMARLNADGSLDPSFSTTLPPDEWVSDMALQNNGHVLVALTPTNSWAASTLLRLDNLGHLDPSFLDATIVCAAWYWRTVIFPMADGSTVSVRTNGSLVRFLSDGSPDPAFTPPANSSPVAALPDGRLLVWAGSESRQLARLTPDGKLDPTFDSSASTHVYGVLPVAEGKIWVLKPTAATPPHPGEILLRLNPDGSIDQSWGGATITSLVGYMEHTRLTSLPDGNLLVVDMAAKFPNGHPRGVLARLLVNAPLPRFEVDPASAAVAENAGNAAIQIVRCGPNSEAMTVQWRTEGGTAIPGMDYVPAGGTLSFAANHSVATIELEVLDNSAVDEDRTVRLQMQAPPPQSQQYPVIEITILNDDLGFPSGGIRRFPNGRVLLRPSGWLLRPPGWSGLWGGQVNVEASPDLKNWNWLGWFDAWSTELIDYGAAADTAQFYRLRGPY